MDDKNMNDKMDFEMNGFENVDTEDWGSDEVQSDVTAEEEDFLEGMEPSKKSMTIFFLIDTSGSMGGTKIGTVNATMEELLPELIGLGGSETDISIAALRYDSTVSWITPEPVRVEEYQQWPRQSVTGMTAMGAAFEELNRKLSRSAFMSKPSLSFAPVIFLMSDGAPNDDWRKGLELLKKNSWYRYGIKVAVGIGSHPDMDVLREFTGDPELAIQAHGAEELKRLIRFLAVTSSQIGSKSMSLTDDGRELTAEDVADTKKKQMRDAVVDLMETEFSDADDMDYDKGW